MIAILIKSAVILTVAYAIAAAFRHKSAAMRHTVWTAGLMGALIIPFCSITLPSWQSSVFGNAEKFLQSFVPAKQAAVSSEPLPNSPANVQAESSSRLDSVPKHEANAGAPAPKRAWPAWSSRSWTQIGVAIWLAGAAIGILMMLIGALRLAWVAFHAEPVRDPRWIELAEDVRRLLGLRRPVRLLQSPSHFLGTWGILTPRVLLPANAAEWTDDRAWMVLGHELAHIQRHDWVVQVLAEAARAIYWFNPVFWLAYSRLRRESEHACDDTVVRMGAGGTQYAEELLELARTLHDENHSHSPILAMAQPSHLERRMVALLNPALNRLAATPWSVVVVALIAIGLTLPLAAIRSPEKVVVTGGSTTAEPTNTTPPAFVSQPIAEPAKAKESTPQLSDAPPLSLAKVEAPKSLVEPLVLPADVAAAPTSASKIGPVAVTKLSAPPVIPPAPFECKVSPAYQETKMKATKEPLGSGPWHINDDRTIWTWDQRYVAGVAVNTMWMKPAESELVISWRAWMAIPPRCKRTWRKTPLRDISRRQ